ncbi:hypothetical protein, partial [Spirulina sp. 06S082]|uniref:hypothetical protein n=1 Tax=Spirulina sp. 06S082 TaxID=3110248 RepID=UPI002B213728
SANTTQTVLRRLEDDWKRQGFDQCIQSLKVQYLGYEINPGFAARAKDFLLGKANADSRSSFFRDFPLFPWNGKEELIIAENMFQGIKKLEQERIYKKSVHFFICSYAFHHVPNGNALKAHLFSGRNFFSPQQIENFIESLKSILNLSNSEPITNSTEEYFKAKAFAEYFRNPQKLDSNGFYKAIDEITKAIQGRSSQKNIDQFLDEFLIDFKLEILRTIRDLLVPGGILAIADPDGTSSFNAERIMVDIEMGVAHFLNVEEIVELLKQARFEHIEYYVVGKTKDTRKDYLFDIVEGKNKSDFEDPNLGYIILAQRPFY